MWPSFDKIYKLDRGEDEAELAVNSRKKKYKKKKLKKMKEIKVFLILILVIFCTTPIPACQGVHSFYPFL